MRKLFISAALLAVAACSDPEPVYNIQNSELPICEEPGQVDCVAEPEPWPDGQPK